MNTSIDELLDFVDKKQSGPELAKVIELLGHKNIRVISIEVFSWLKRQQRFRHEKALELSQNHTWSQELPLMFDEWPSFGELFVIDSGKCNFRETISTDERNRIRTLVTERYQPLLRT